MICSPHRVAIKQGEPRDGAS